MVVLMSDLRSHYHLLLGLDADWRVDDVELKMSENRVEISLVHGGGQLRCAECDQGCSQADTAPPRQWRHLDTMQFETIIKARVPRSKCSSCGVKTIAVPWSGKHSRFTLMFEALAISILQAARSVSSGADVLGVSWKTAHTLMRRGVERGLERRGDEPIDYIGIDEKSFGKGQDYVSLMVDIEGSRVLEVAKDRSEESCDQLLSLIHI